MPDRELVEKLDRTVRAVLARQEPPVESDPELGALAEIAAALRDLPSEKFRTALKVELQRRTVVATSITTAAGFRTITPFIIHAKAPELVDFIKATFGAEELKRTSGGEANGFYSELRIGDTVIMIGGGSAAQWGNLPSALHVYVEDCDAAYRRALHAGATTMMGEQGEPADRPYGERSAFVLDAFGNYWYIATRLGSAPEPAGDVLPYLHPEHARTYIDFLKQAFGAEEVMVVEESGRVMHAAVRLGDAVVEMGEPADRTGVPTNGLFVFVDDADAAFSRAVSAGATAVRPPADLPSGVRCGVVRDPAGYFWWPARWIS